MSANDRWDLTWRLRGRNRAVAFATIHEQPFPPPIAVGCARKWANVSGCAGILLQRGDLYWNKFRYIPYHNTDHF
jgi:hypothetical protein